VLISSKVLPAQPTAVAVSLKVPAFPAIADGIDVLDEVEDEMPVVEPVFVHATV
jgi:hypothetical protein